MPKDIIVCKNCGDTVEYERVKKPRQFCSTKCGYQFHNRNSRNKEEERQRQARLREEFPEKNIIYRFRSAAKKAGRSFNLSEKWVKDRLARGVCEVTGLPFAKKTYKRGDCGKRTFFTPSIDRIDNNGDYIESNVRLVCWGYNLVKNSFTDREVMAVSLATILQTVPQQLRPDLVKLLPPFVVSTLPSGNGFIDINGNPIINASA